MENGERRRRSLGRSRNKSGNENKAGATSSIGSGGGKLPPGRSYLPARPFVRLTASSQMDIYSRAAILPSAVAIIIILVRGASVGGAAAQNLSVRLSMLAGSTNSQVRLCVRAARDERNSERFFALVCSPAAANQLDGGGGGGCRLSLPSNPVGCQFLLLTSSRCGERTNGFGRKERSSIVQLLARHWHWH